MALAWLSLLLAFAALTSRAMAGDNRTSSDTASANAAAQPQSSAPHDFVLAPEAQDRVPVARLRTRQARNLAGMNGNICYTMRTYKVKPTERVRDRENVFRGYSECEMASNYQIRSAEAHPREPHSDEAPATLK